MRPFYSLIIPCYNPDETICRLFDSLLRQDISKNDLEILVIDDGSSSLNYRDKISSYGFKVSYYSTDTDIHCPGNTRRQGVSLAKGKWVLFADQDDFFEDNSLSQVKEYIESCSEVVYVVSTIMRSYSVESREYRVTYAHSQTWIHGKFYSVDNLIRPFNINFKRDLYTHEDVYFNSLVLSNLVLIGKDWNYLDVYTYVWVDNPNSLTRKPSEDRGYLFENFEDYLVSASEPFVEALKISNNEFFVNQIMMTLLHAYFYYEAAVFFQGSENYCDIKNLIEYYVKEVMLKLGFSVSYILEFIYSDPDKYYRVKESCEWYTGKFIPRTSFKDFIHELLGI